MFKQFVVILALALCALPAEGRSIMSAGTTPTAEMMFPFHMTMLGDNDATRSLVDLSPSRAAGADGFITVKDGHFMRGNERIRFWGTNVAFNGCFPKREDAPRIAAHMARLGMNIVRLHSSDACDGNVLSLIDKTCSGTTTLDPSTLDAFDYFISELKKHGVYVNINLKINREPRLADGICDKVPYLCKNVSLFDRRIIDLQKDYARTLLGHKNPYTGNTYADEPAVAFIEVNNEDSFFYSWYGGELDTIPPCYAEELTSLWKQWQREKRGVAAGAEAERPKFDKDTLTSPTVMDYMAFLYDTEYAYYKEMRDCLKKDIGVKSLVTGTIAFSFVGAKMQADLFDYVDIHGYWCHPWKTKDAATGEEYYTFVNDPMVWDKNFGPLACFSCLRVAGKPFTMSEYNTTTGQWFEAENLPLGAAYAAAMDWDALYSFNWNQTGDFDENMIVGGFDLCANPVRVAQTVVGSYLFLRGDQPISPAAYQPRAELNTSDILSVVARYPWYDTSRALTDACNTTLPAEMRVACFVPTSGASALVDVPTTESLGLPRLDAEDGRRLIETSRTLGIVGPLDANGTAVNNGDGITMTVSGKTFAAVTLSALNWKAASLGQSDKLLLVAGGRTQNTGMKWRADGRGLTDHGTSPTLTEGVAARVALKGIPANARVFPLDECGVPRRHDELHKKVAKPDEFDFVIGPEYKTIWYLIELSK